MTSSALHYSFRQQNVLFERWFHFLAFVNENPRNKELLSDYLFTNFAQSPELFYRFLLFFKKKIHSAPKKSLQKHLALKYLEVISQLCERFGFFKEKNILDDFCFYLTDRIHYEAIDAILSKYKKESQRLMHDIKNILAKRLQQTSHGAEVTGRYKNIYSVFKKLSKKRKKNALTIKDIFAFRIITSHNSSKECFEILNILHDTFYPIADFFKDYITIPKINGYQSLHTGLSHVTPDLDLPIEVQIRTMAMDNFAECGIAAHWLYSCDKKSKLLTEKEERLVAYFSSLGYTVQNNACMALSYKGDLFQLEPNSTILDFAYAIHTDLGNKALGALVNNKKKALNYVIREGDSIEVLQASTDQVKEEWLTLVRPHAYKKVLEYLKKHAPAT